ncbi:hypothetical protein C0J52_28223 [Blattella germanica]|nr:hypothetical protein C0J52_28223 [Blattella germanica]
MSSSALPPPTINMDTTEQSASVPDQPLRRILRPRPHRLRWLPQLQPKRTDMDILILDHGLRAR